MRDEETIDVLIGGYLSKTRVWAETINGRSTAAAAPAKSVDVTPPPRDVKQG